ncbi:MAG: hypothetical protein DMF74_19710 [Acidobacteria bacterium]|nr:MAG: hypothetical protein DMF74_19710 [Acidobacteriota bacterium]
MDIAANLRQFNQGQNKNKGRQVKERYSSFDYCFNYFQTFRDEGRIQELSQPAQIQASCLQLGFYLASWGMLRGSSFLLEKSVKFYEPLIEGIATFDNRAWAVDADSYGANNIRLLLDCREMIKESLGWEHRPSDTLITKIMLGVFGNVPAFDDYFRKGFGVHSFGKNSLNRIADFYEKNKSAIDRNDIYTLDYASGEFTKRKYTKAKIIDMVGFIEGIRKQSVAMGKN